MHQMESNGPRFFAPPNVDPIDPNYDPLIWREAALLGSAMTLELAARSPQRRRLERDLRLLLARLRGLGAARPQHRLPADRSREREGRPRRSRSRRPTFAPASEGRARLPAANQLSRSVARRRWTLRDIVDYDLSAVRGLLRAVSAYRETHRPELLRHGRARRRRRQPRRSVRVHHPARAARSVGARRSSRNCCCRAAIEIQRALEPFRADGDPYPAGSDIILLAQPYRAYVKTLLERQDYPGAQRRRAAAAERPYDVAGWTLPAQMGVDVRTIERTFEPPAMSRVTDGDDRAGRGLGRSQAGVLPRRRPRQRRRHRGQSPAGRRPECRRGSPRRSTSAATSTRRLARRDAAEEHRCDAHASTDRKPARPARRRRERKAAGERSADLARRASACTSRGPRTSTKAGRAGCSSSTSFHSRASATPTSAPASCVRSSTRSSCRARRPSASPAGQSADVVPAEYAGGLGEPGVAALRAFVEAGGTLICLDQAGGFAVSAFELPIRDVTRDRQPTAFFCPGSIVRIEIDPTQPLAYGMSRTRLADSLRPELRIRRPAESRATTAARYGATDVLLSGWLEGEQVIAGRPAVVQVSVGAGRVVLLGFPVQHRGQSLATFRLLFNAILTSR